MGEVMDFLSGGVKKLQAQVQVQYAHSKHSELAMAIFEEKEVADAFDKVASAKTQGMYDSSFSLLQSLIM